MSDMLRPTDLLKIANDAEAAALQKTLDHKHAVEDEQKALREAFMNRELTAHAKERFNSAIRRAAEAGHRELLGLTFPSSYCNDAGRRINNLDADWPISLEGYAKIAYEFYCAELQPLGYKLSARILDYPNGRPGNVGLFLSW